MGLFREEDLPEPDDLDREIEDALRLLRYLREQLERRRRAEEPREPPQETLSLVGLSPGAGREPWSR
jgi:hypothetical protein